MGDKDGMYGSYIMFSQYSYVEILLFNGMLLGGRPLTDNQV
jgi:hypothetical protein